MLQFLESVFISKETRVLTLVANVSTPTKGVFTSGSISIIGAVAKDGFVTGGFGASGDGVFASSPEQAVINQATNTTWQSWRSRFSKPNVFKLPTRKLLSSGYRIDIIFGLLQW